MTLYAVPALINRIGRKAAIRSSVSTKRRSPKGTPDEPVASSQRIKTSGTLQARIMAVVVDPMIRLRMREWP